MKILVINSTNHALKYSLLDFVISNQNLTSIIILEKPSGITQINSFRTKIDSNKEVTLFTTDFLDEEKVSKALLFSLKDTNTLLKVIFVEDSSTKYGGEFATFDIFDFRKKLQFQLEEKISLFKVLLRIIKQKGLSAQIIVLVPEYSQTTLIGENVPQSISFSASHMLTTAIADESIDFGVLCNAVLETDSYINTLDYLFFESNNKTHGKLYKDKKIVMW